MLKKTIEYSGYDGETYKEDFYFNLNQAEIVEMELGIEGGFVEMLQRISTSKNVPEMIKTFKEMIMKAYGVKSNDNKRFIKSPELSIEFTQTEAYSVLLLELLSDPNKAAEFVNSIIPKNPNKDNVKQFPTSEN